MNDIKELLLLYNEIKPRIDRRIEEFNYTWNNGSEYDFYKELLFCLLTPQSKAERCWQAVEKLENNNLLFCNDSMKIAECIRTLTRFHHTKAHNIVCLQNTIVKHGKTVLREKLQNFSSITEMREWLVENIKGMGYKEASHFLRNIGKGEELAILDRHILRKLVEFKIVKKIPTSLTKNAYMQLEDLMKRFAQGLNIPLAHLDILFWYQTTGKFFK